ncbi:MAG: PQQ-like beta-propeller repeat protein [Chloroflexaceae bacterium]|jgi:DNA-binding beta-propeller fold protein YncE|nr:PQQ-like beta-propeller repeat protein [Chloroflexaceae bacterium]
MRCDETRLLLASRRDLPLGQRLELEEHLRRCPACAAAARAEEQTSRALQSLPQPRVAPPANLGASLQRRLQRRPRWRGWVGVGVPIALVLASLLFSGIMPGGWSAAVSTVQQALTAGQPAASGTLYMVTNANGSLGMQLTALDTVTGQERFSLALPNSRRTIITYLGTTGSGNVDIVLSPDGTRLYLVTYNESDRTASLRAIDTANGQERWRIPLQGVAMGSAGNLTLAGDGRRLYVRSDATGWEGSHDFSTGTLQVIDTTTGSVQEQAVRLATNGMPHVIAATGTDVYAGTLGSSMQAVPLASSDRTNAPTLDFSAITGFSSPDGQLVYAIGAELRIAVIDTASRSIVREEDPEPRGHFFFDPGMLAVSADGSRMAVARTLCSEGCRGRVSELRLYDTATWRELARRRLEVPLLSLALSADGRTLYGAVATTNPLATADRDVLRPSSTMLELNLITGEQRQWQPRPGENVLHVLGGR